MQDRFVGDIGDFGKYSLLRALTGIYPPLPEDDRLSLGVVWYRNHVKAKSGVGQNVGYLFDTDSERNDCFRSCDQDLFDNLKEIVCEDRNLEAIKERNILGESVFFEEPVRNDRASWCLHALASTKGRDIVFLDPDNGIAMDSNHSLEHVYFHEIQSYVRRDQTVVIYHHIGRMFNKNGAKAPEQMRGWAARLQDKFSLKPEILWYRRGSARAYFVLPAVNDVKRADAIYTRLAAFRESAWFARKHFTALPQE